MKQLLKKLSVRSYFLFKNKKSQHVLLSIIDDEIKRRDILQEI